MDVLIVGQGKLAQELLREMRVAAPLRLLPWDGRTAGAPAVVVHAGSGRELAAVAAFCQASRSPLIELSTGSAVEGMAPAFPVVLCPNTNLLMLKFMSLLGRAGALFDGVAIEVVESHQASKQSVPGTAVAMAQSLGVPPERIVSVRDPAVQAKDLQIPEAHLARHAFHRIRLHDAVCSVTLETRVYGDSPYAAGVSAIVGAVAERTLDDRIYPVNELIERGWV